MEITEEVEIQHQAPALDPRTRAELDAQIEIAKRYPRSIKRFMDECMSMATLNEDVAASCLYALPRGGKSIEGPSARLAEIIVSAWGNAQAGARVVDEGMRFVTAQGVARDLERNTTITFEVRRRITDKHGNRFNDDMIGVTANAAASIALRNAVFKMVPKAFWEPIYQAARGAAIGDVKTIETKRADMVGYFGKMGITPDRILSTMGLAGVEDIGPEQLMTLRGIATALKEGDISPETAFPTEEAPKSARTESVKEKLRKRGQEPDEATPAKEAIEESHGTPTDGQNEAELSGDTADN